MQLWRKVFIHVVRNGVLIKLVVPDRHDVVSKVKQEFVGLDIGGKRIVGYASAWCQNEC
jgi:hypothetical protein